VNCTGSIGQRQRPAICRPERQFLNARQTEHRLILRFRPLAIGNINVNVINAL
jgi:hypothetical protein